MAGKKYTPLNRPPSHAGEILKSGFIDQYELSMVTVSDLLGVRREHLFCIVNGRAPVTSGIAAKLEILTHTPAALWLAMQAKYDAYHMKQSKFFGAYKAIEAWATGSLCLAPAQRRKDEEMLALVAKASKLARCVGRKNNV
jgi:addiction module HigA family antidote